MEYVFYPISIQNVNLKKKFMIKPYIFLFDKEIVV